MKLITWNVNGLAPTLKNIELQHGTLRAFFDSLGADIVCLQETKLEDTTVTPAMRNVAGFESFWTCSKDKRGYSGCATFVRLDFAACAAQDDTSLHGEPDLQREGRFLLTDHGHFVLINVYAPNAGVRPARARLPFKLRWFRALQERLDALAAQGRRVVVVGDLNIARSRRDAHPAIDWQNIYQPEELQALAGVTMRHRDIWREQHADESGAYTVWDERTNARAANRGLRIDYILCSEGMAAVAGRCEIEFDMPRKWSDHAPVEVTFSDIQPHALEALPAPCALSSRKAAARGIGALFAGAAARQSAPKCAQAAVQTLAENSVSAGSSGEASDAVGASEAAATPERASTSALSAPRVGAAARRDTTTTVGGAASARLPAGSQAPGSDGHAPPEMLAQRGTAAHGSGTQKRRLAADGPAQKKQRSMAAFLVPKR